MAKRLALTLGDPGGIGPEIVDKALAQVSDPDRFVVFGQTKTRCLGQANADNGRCAYHAIVDAVSAIKNGDLSGLVTAPICKESFQLADIPFTGHTTLLASLSADADVRMAFYTPQLLVMLQTIHVPLKKVSSLISVESLSQTIDRAVLFCQQLGVLKPRIAVAGLNPHAGENGLLGDEESEVLVPVIKQKRQVGVCVEGPFPGDAVFRQAIEGKFDLVIAMYHDQGLIPVKLVGFSQAVNVTVGLPYVRTSPDHGTAFDIVGQDKANPESLLAAMELALKLV